MLDSTSANGKPSKHPKQVIVDWIIQANGMIVKKSFLVTWISNALEGHEDELVRNDLARRKIDEVLFGGEVVGFQEPDNECDPFESSSEEDEAPAEDLLLPDSITSGSSTVNPSVLVHSNGPTQPLSLILYFLQNLILFQIFQNKCMEVTVHEQNKCTSYVFLIHDSFQFVNQLFSPFECVKTGDFYSTFQKNGP